jgi:hypothetical protein
MAHEGWTAWVVVQASLMALVLVIYLVLMLRRPDGRHDATVTSGGIFTAVGLALMLAGMLPVTGSARNSLIGAGSLLAVSGPLLRRRFRRATPDRT